MPDSADIHTRIANALALLGEKHAADPAQARQSVHLAIDALEASREAIAGLEEELEAVTDPTLDAAHEVLSLRQELEASRKKVTELEAKLLDLRTEAQVRDAVYEEEHNARKDLERKVREVNKTLLEDDDAFNRFMDAALEEDERKGNLS